MPPEAAAFASARIGFTKGAFSVLAVPQFSGLRSMLAGTELLATVPDYAADALIDGCGLRADDPPFPIFTSELSMAWSSRTDNDPAERWLRELIVQHMSAPPLPDQPAA